MLGHVEWVTFADGEPPGRGQIATAAHPFALLDGGERTIVVVGDDLQPRSSVGRGRSESEHTFVSS